jgi:DNA-binding Lrp family transcriptional regulator
VSHADAVARPPGVWFDRRGRELLQALIRDGGATVASMARDTDLTENAVRHRIGSLAKAGFIERTVVKLNRSMLGYTEVDFIHVAATIPVDLEKLTRLRGVLAVYRGRNKHDFLITITSVNFEDYCRVMAGIIDATGDQQPTELFRGSVLHEDYEGGNVFRHLFEHDVQPITDKPKKRETTTEQERPVLES